MLTLRTVRSLAARYNRLAGLYHLPTGTDTPGRAPSSDGQLAGVSSSPISGFSFRKYVSMKRAVSQERMRLR